MYTTQMSTHRHKITTVLHWKNISITLVAITLVAATMGLLSYTGVLTGTPGLLFSMGAGSFTMAICITSMTLWHFE